MLRRVDVPIFAGLNHKISLLVTISKNEKNTFAAILKTPIESLSMPTIITSTLVMVSHYGSNSQSCCLLLVQATNNGQQAEKAGKSGSTLHLA